MTKLPEKIRRTLEKLVKEMRTQENIYGVGLFGSWSRGDAAETSDVDLLLIDKSDPNHEFVERIEKRGLLIDLDHIPKKWIHNRIPPELDQKIYEMKILYDRDWSLTNAKLMITKSYTSPERIDIRTESHIVQSDIYLSRATSAFSREDFPSAQLFATMALENIMKVLIEIALEPSSNSRFIQKLKQSTTKLDLQTLFDEYLHIAGLHPTGNTNAEDKLKLFKAVWDEISFTTQKNPKALHSSHFRVKTKMEYYLNPAFLQGMIMRTKSLINSGKTTEATHYLNNTFTDIIENYAWSKASIHKTRIDNTTLIRSLHNLEEKNPKNYKQILNFLKLTNTNKSNAAHTIHKTKKNILKIRRQRKVLIKNHLIKN